MPSERPPEFVERLLDDEFGCGGSFCYCDMHRRTAYEPALAFLRAVLRQADIVLHADYAGNKAFDLMRWAGSEEDAA